MTASRPVPLRPLQAAALALALGLVLGLLLGGFADNRLARPAPPREIRYTPITFDPGVTTTPAISPDGKLVAYASDRAGGHNLDLYVQQLRGGDPARLTWTADNESHPSFSADGSTLVYHSTTGGGAIYTIPSLGGAPRLVAPGGQNPRFSPRGRQIAYWTGLRDGLAEGQAKTFVVSAEGGGPRRIRPDFLSVQRPVWSPDGQRLLVWGVPPGEGFPADRADFWVMGLEQDRAVSAGLAGPVERAGGALTDVDDLSWTELGLVFSMRTGWVRSLYRCRMSPAGKAEGDLVRLAGGTASTDFPAVSRDGQLVFAGGAERFDVWGLPLDANSGKARGPIYRITNSTAPAEYPTVSPDGRNVLYATPRNGTSQIWRKNLATGEETVIAAGPNASVPLWLHGNAGAAFVQKLNKRSVEYLLDLSTSQTNKVYEGGFFWDVNSKSTEALAQASDSNQNDIFAVDLKTGHAAVILRGVTGRSLIEANYSPDDSRIVFLADTGPGTAQIHTARPNGMSEISSSEWTSVTDGRSKVDKPRFSPDGQLIYFTLDREGKRGIRAIRFDPSSGQPLGDSFPVWDSDQPRLTLFDVSSRSLEIGIARDKLVMLLAERSSNLWAATLDSR